MQTRKRTAQELEPACGPYNLEGCDRKGRKEVQAHPWGVAGGGGCELKTPKMKIISRDADAAFVVVSGVELEQSNERLHILCIFRLDQHLNSGLWWSKHRRSFLLGVVTRQGHFQQLCQDTSLLEAFEHHQTSQCKEVVVA